jgi:hypothetical protein
MVRGGVAVVSDPAVLPIVIGLLTLKPVSTNHAATNQTTPT